MYPSVVLTVYVLVSQIHISKNSALIVSFFDKQVLLCYFHLRYVYLLQVRNKTEKAWMNFMGIVII